MIYDYENYFIILKQASKHLPNDTVLMAWHSLIEFAVTLKNHRRVILYTTTGLPRHFDADYNTSAFTSAGR